MSDGVSPEEQALIAVRRMRAKLEAIERAQTEPIAIVGAACRFPGATAPEGFWSLLAGGVDAIREVPAGRWPDPMLRGMPGSGPEAQARRWGGFLDDVSGFDAGFFGISPREATKMDPQQRILLEVVHDALEDAGIVPSRIAGSDAGVFVGMSNTDYAHLHDPLSSDVYTATGTANSVAAGRLSYVFDLQGPSVVIDTACSSSLVAVHVACESLRRGECSVAIVGGVNLMLSPYTALLTSKIFALSPDGRCRTFDARANGFVRGEGCGVVVLKRLSKAVADGDVVRAKIGGSAINQDGRSAGLTAPNALAQKAVIERALKQAKVDASLVGYVEMHGTGTPLGDPIEFDALKETYGRGGAGAGAPMCALGAVKTNIGHLEAAAGVAGLIKTMLVLEQRVVPPNLHFEQLNPRISLEGTRFAFPTSPQELGPSVRYAAVSSFGISGTNAHVILEAADPAQTSLEPAARAPRPVVLGLSARTETALAALAGRYAEWLERTSPDLEAVAASLAQTRTHHDQRLAVVAGDRAEAVGALRAAARGEILPGASRSVVRSRRPKIAFVFSGQGSQWEGMGKELLEQPPFAEKLRECDEAIRAEAGFSVVEAVTREGPASRLSEIEVVQPTLFAMAVSLAALWRTWGVVPSAVVGHSLGEVAAAQVSGALSLKDAARVICARSRLVRRTVGRGGMLAAELSAAEAEALVQRWAGRVEVAAENGPRTVLLSGETEALAEAMRALEGRGVFVRPVKVDYASHSAQMDELGPDLGRELASVMGRPGAVPIYSTLTGEVEDGSRLGSEYWVRNLRERVRFAGAIERLVASGHQLFVEVSPHPVLTTAIEPMLGAAQRVVGTLRREQPSRRQMLESLGALYVRGYEGIQWKELGADARPRQVRLPTYAYDRERYWVEVHSERARASGHPLLGEPTEVSTERGVHVWETELREEGYLSEHRVLDAAVLAGSSYVEMALQGAAAVLGGSSPSVSLEDVTLIEPLVLVAEERTRVQLVMKAMGGDEGRASFTVSSRRAGPNVSGWTVHARGSAVRAAGERPRALPGDDDPRRGDTERRIDSKEHYEALAASGLSYGAAFRGVEEIVVSPGSPRSARGRVKATDAVRAEAGRFGWHPALLDAVLQVVAPAIDAGAGTWVPAGMRRIVGAQAAPRLAEGTALAVRAIATGKAEADVEVTDPHGALLLRIEGLQLSQLREAAGDVIGSWLHEVAWEPRPRADTVASSAPGAWVIFADEGGRWRGIEAGLGARGAEVTVVPPAAPISTYARVLATHGAKLRGIVHACALDGGAPSRLADLEKAQEKGTLGLLALIQATAELGLRDPPRIWVLTREARTMSGIAHAPLWGLCRVAAHEHPELRCTVVDVDDRTRADAICLELIAGDREDLVLLHGAERLVPRIHRLRGHAPPASPAASRPFRLEIDRPGVLERLALRSVRRRAPGPHEVEIEVRAASVNFLDVLSALGVRPDAVPGKPPILGGECAGIVVAVGEGVTHVGVGDDVIAIAAFAMASHVTTRASFVVAKPGALSFEEAAALPLVSMTAAYGLERLAHLRRGERVLVHAGAGGVGLAAIRIAQRLGAEVFATAGRPDKRDYLRSIGVAHVMDSRTLDFAREVREATKGEGVDVVLNCLTGPALTASLDILAPYGRFVEIGKRDIYDDSPVGLFAFRKNISYFAVDFARMLDERPALVSELLGEVALRAAEGELAGLPVTAHPMSKAADAFGTISAARHVGKLVLTLPDPEVRVAPARFELDPTCSYLVTGGLGGLGLRVAAWLVERGARHVALLGRSAPRGEAVAAIEALRAAGADVRAYAADVSREDALGAVLDAVRAELGPLRGVVHAAAVLDDGLLAKDAPERFERVMAPKSSGAWNLHASLAGADLDFFVLFSSAASLVGSAGQGSYAAGNAFLDALAEARRSVGLPATTIQWGPWAEIGLAAARADRGERLAAEGMASMTPEQGLDALARILDGGLPLVAVLPWNAKQWLELHPVAGRSPLFDAVRGQGGAPDAQRGDAKLLQALAEGSEAGRRERLEGHLREQVGRVLRMDPARVPLEAPFGSLGLDSLMGLEIRNRLETTLGLTLSTTLLWTHPTVRGLSAYVAERLGFGAPSPGEATATAARKEEEGKVAAIASLNELPVDDLTAMLAAELAASRGRADG